MLVQEPSPGCRGQLRQDIGHRVAGANLADVAAMVAMPTCLVVAPGLAVHAVGWVLDFLDDGLAAGCLEGIGASVVVVTLSSGTPS